MLLYWLYSYCFDTKSINCEVSALFSAADRCFPRARLQPPREAHSVGSSDTCYSRRTRKATTAFASHEENWFVFSRSHHLPLTRTSVVVQRNFLITKKLMISKLIPAKETHEDSCGKSGQSKTPQNG